MANGQKKRLEFSKLISLLVILMGFAIVQECFVLMYLCIKNGYVATAAWLTAAVGLAEVVIGLGVKSYHAVSTKQNTRGGITYEAAKAKNFTEDGPTI